MIYRLSIVLLCFLFTSICFAEDRWHVSKIKRIYPTADGGFVLTFITSSAECTVNATEKYHYVTVGQNDMTIEGANKMYALALASAAQGKEVRVNFDDSTTKCYINRMFTFYE